MINKLYNEICKLHMEISNLKTPREYVSNDRPDGSGIDYPEPKYMRAILMKYFPTVSWTCSNSPIFDPHGKIIEWVTHGSLKWDYGLIGHPEVRREGSMSASHSIMYTRDNKDKLVDMGNDVKSSNTDCWKKALNFYLNICDDIYRWEHPGLSDEELSEVSKLIEQAKIDNKSERLETLNNTFLINKLNKDKIITLYKSKI